MPRTVLCQKLGPPEDLVLTEMPRHKLAPGEVRVAIAAAGINFPDTLTILGKYQHKPPLPFVPGVESAGTIVEVAGDAGPWRVGDRVITRQRTGGYAEEIGLPARQLAPLPEGFDFAEGASFLVASLTAYHALVERAALRPGETLLVHGAAGGVGLAAVELGKVLGAHVIATASTPEKLAVARRRGADHLIDYSREDFVASVRQITSDRGVDVVFDPVGGEALTQSLRAVAWGGRVLVVGFASGSIPELAANRILLKGCSVIGVRAGEAGRQDPARRRCELDAVLALAAQGQVRPLVSARFPLPEWAAAMRLLKSRKAIGRVALEMDGA
jgi:NADPH:quinone reductase